MSKRVQIWLPGTLLPDGTSNDGCTEYRLLGPARPLIAQGMDVVPTDVGPTVLWSHDWDEYYKMGYRQPPEGVTVMGLAQRPDADVVVLQRPGRRHWAEIIPMLQKLGIRVVVDVDDLFDRIDKENTSHGDYDPNKRDSHNLKWIDLACRRADLVTVTTPALLDRYGYGHGMVLPNMVPDRYLSFASEPLENTVGWTGTVDTHPTDLQVTRGAVGKALDAAGWSFHHVGTGVGIKDALGLSREPTATGWVPFSDYAHRMAEIGVGIVPLADTKFNQAKSCLKVAEFAALGVPVISTATYDNDRMRKLGVGVTVKHPSQWSRALQRMLGDRDYREQIAGRSREIMAEHTYERNAHLWWTAWTGEK